MNKESMIVGIALAVSGCASTPVVPTQTQALAVVPPGKAKIVLMRNMDALFLGVKAAVDVNGIRVAELWRGESHSQIVEPGEVNLAADAWSTPGHYRAHFRAEPDKEYTFEISPRGGHFASLAFFGIVGAAVNAGIDENTGPFVIQLKHMRPLR